MINHVDKLVGNGTSGRTPSDFDEMTEVFLGNTLTSFGKSPLVFRGGISSRSVLLALIVHGGRWLNSTSTYSSAKKRTHGKGFEQMTRYATAILTALLMTASSADAASIVIDDFDSGLQVLTAFAPGIPTATGQAAGTMIGGERDVSLTITSSTGASTVTAALGGGAFDVGNGPPPSSAFVVSTWDGPDSSAAPGDIAGFTPTDFTFGGLGGDILVDFVDVDANGTPILSALTLIDSVGGMATVTSAISSVGLVTIPLASFVGVDLTSIVAVQGSLELGPNDDVSIAFIEVRSVPEASTVIVWSSILALGCCGAWVKRNRK